MDVDLTKIDKPFGELSRETQLALFSAWLDGSKVDKLVEGSWEHAYSPYWFACHVYRLQPKPLTKPGINWDHVAEEWKWLSQDANEVPFLHMSKPSMHMGNGWCNEEYKYAYARSHASYTPGTCDWKDSLVERPE